MTIPATESGAYVDIDTIDDGDAEGLETITVTIQPDTGSPRTHGLEVSSATLTLLDDDSGFSNTLAFAETSQTVSEDSGTIGVPVSRSGSGLASTSCSVEYAIRYSTALGAGVDFQMATGRLEFAPGQDTLNVPIEIIDDLLTENVESIIVRLRHPINAEIASNTDRSTVFIRDNEPRITVTATDPFAYETDDTAEFRISRDGTTVGALVVPLTVSGTAVSGVDFAAMPASVTIPDGATSVDLTLTPLAHSAINVPLTVEVAVAPSGSSVPGVRSSATATIGDAESDDPPFVHLVSPRGDSPGVPSDVTLRLETIVTDDTPGSLTTAWSKFSGPGTVTFEDASSPSTGAMFSSAGAYTLRLTANDGGQITTLDVPVTVGAPILPWVHTNVGTTTYPGSAAEHRGFVAISASGTNLSGSTDELFFRHRELNGDGEVIARVRHVLTSNANARLGIMIRESTASNSRMAAIHLTPDASFSGASNRSSYQRRTSTSVSTTNSDGTTPSSWVRLTRAGNVFTAYDSPDGVNWTQRGQNTISIGTNALAGIAITSSNSSELTLGEVDNVRIVGTPDNNGPLVDAGPAANATVGSPLALAGVITDDALPSDPGSIEAGWVRVSGPGAASFSDSSDPTTEVTFSEPGTYALRLVADDGEVSTSDDVMITVTVPTVTVVATGDTASEDGLLPGAFTISRSETAGELTVHFAMTGTATEGADYETVSSAVFFPDGSTTAAVAVVPKPDDLAEGSESVTLVLTGDAGYAVGSPPTAMVTLLDLPGDDWRFQEFGADANDPAIAGMTVDLDLDGLTNLEEYAYGSDPDGPGAAPIATETTTIGQDSYLGITITRNPDATDLSFEVQATSDLTDELSWSSAGLVIEVDTPTTLRVRDTVPMANGIARFMRLKITE